jgi:TATA-box binding protein (TBP) (component of TFIID and TFIIIB)
LLQEFIPDCSVISKSVDNIIASTSVDKKLDLCLICSSGVFKSIKYNNEKFPGLFIKFENLGTAILFHSGKIVIVGSKTRNNIECLIQKIYARI